MRSRIRRSVRAAILTLVATAVLAAGVLAPCGEIGCCAHDGGQAMHREMPCCDESTVGARETPRILAAASAGLVGTTCAPVATVAAAASPGAMSPSVQATRTIDPPAPPLFLRNEQFRI